eukprot:TRINITY_DN7458_c0_g1_i9.p2 TRINITY_DN7458_c0_g1~~TRINITY_DN7458_c0_g1_i9.p2  ORF type:complete len:198 (+),score=-19.26 TRINITY_DN7458_c0_g1_i9:41-595(+)
MTILEIYKLCARLPVQFRMFIGILTLAQEVILKVICVCVSRSSKKLFRFVFNLSLCYLHKFLLYILLYELVLLHVSYTYISLQVYTTYQSLQRVTNPVCCYIGIQSYTKCQCSFKGYRDCFCQQYMSKVNQCYCVLIPCSLANIKFDCALLYLFDHCGDTQFVRTDTYHKDMYGFQFMVCYFEL